MGSVGCAVGPWPRRGTGGALGGGVAGHGLHRSALDQERVQRLEKHRLAHGLGHAGRHALLLEGGEQLVVYHDLIADVWFEQRDTPGAA